MKKRTAFTILFSTTFWDYRRSSRSRVTPDFDSSPCKKPYTISDVRCSLYKLLTHYASHLQYLFVIDCCLFSYRFSCMNFSFLISDSLSFSFEIILIQPLSLKNMYGADISHHHTWLRIYDAH